MMQFIVASTLFEITGSLPSQISLSLIWYVFYKKPGLKPSSKSFLILDYILVLKIS